MSLRIVSLVVMLAVFILGFVAWTRYRPAASLPAAGNAESDAMPPAGADRVAPGPGVAWDKPERWVLEPGHAMRLATYRVPGPAAGVAPGECAVHYFGPGQGGSVKLNLERWSGEFQGGAEPELAKLTAGGVKVTRARMHGTYLAHAGMDDAGDEPRREVTLLGAIIEAPRGPVFVKLVGPSPTVAAAAQEFDGLLRSIHPAEGRIE